MAEKINYEQLRYGTKDGELKFGHITADNEIAACLLRNFYNYTHYIEMTRTGDDHRKDGTICRAPGSFQIRAGDNCPKDIPGVYVEAVSGDLVLRAPSGRVRIEGQNVDINASGFDGENGVIDLSANEKIILDAGQIVDIKAKVSCKVFSEGTVDCIGRQVLNIYGGMIDCADAAATSKTSLGSKGGSANEIKNKIEV